MDKVFIIKIIMAILIIFVAGLFVHWYNTKATIKQKEKINKWLLGAVAQAQMDFGKDTGPIKLSAVYGLFLALFPTKTTNKIPFALFETMVIAAKAELVKLQSENKSIDTLIKGGVSK